MINYEWRTFSFTGVLTSLATPILSANSRRVAVSVSADRTVAPTLTGCGYLCLNLNATTRLVCFNLPCTFMMPWRDWGPVLEEPLFLTSTDIGSTYIITEIFRL